MASLTFRVEIAFGAILTADPSTWAWFDATADVYARDGITASHGNDERANQTEPATLKLTLLNKLGRYTPTNPLSPYHPNVAQNTPIRLWVNAGSGDSLRGTYFVDSWTPQWSEALSVATVVVSASGRSRALGRVKASLHSPIYNMLSSSATFGIPVAYWPCEDIKGATSLAEYSGQQPLVIMGEGATLAAGGPAGSAPLPRLSGGLGGTGFIPASMTRYPTKTGWSMTCVFNCDSLGTGSQPIIEIHTDGGIQTLRYTIFVNDSPVSIGLEGWDNAGNYIVNDRVSWIVGGVQSPIQTNFFLVITAQKQGGNIQFSWKLTNCDTLAQLTRTFTVTQWWHNVNWFQVPEGYDHRNWLYGHFSLWPGAYTFPTASLTGYNGQLAADRIVSVCNQRSVPVAIIGNNADTMAMGPQPTAAIMPTIEECVAADGGTLYDGFDSKLTYRTRKSQYNAPAKLTASLRGEQVAAPFTPTYDDAKRLNDSTVTRSGGSSGHVTRITGPFGVPTVGTYDQSVTLNLATDDQVISQAGWRVNQASVDELRYPQLSLHLGARPELRAAWQTIDVGDRVTITNPPAEAPPGNIDLVVNGWTETYGTSRWDVVANCSPYLPWRVYTIADSALGYIDTGGSFLNAAVTAAATSLAVASTALPKWTTSPSGLFVNIGGERMAVTAVANTTPAFIAAGTAAHANNAPVTPGLPAGLAAGHLLLCFAAIRRTTATPVKPAGYALLADMGNAELWGKIAVSGEVAPTISFTGGSANDTTSAQMAAFSNATTTIEAYSDAQVNASAQNIAFPAVQYDNPGSIIIYLGWKQSNWTSVATVTGATAEIGEPSSALGSTQGIVWDYAIPAVSDDVGAGSFVVTGGVSAVSAGALVALRADVQTFTVTRAVNGISKAQALGTPVGIWQPGVIGL